MTLEGKKVKQNEPPACTSGFGQIIPLVSAGSTRAQGLKSWAGGRQLVLFTCGHRTSQFCKPRGVKKVSPRGVKKKTRPSGQRFLGSEFNGSEALVGATGTEGERLHRVSLSHPLSGAVSTPAEGEMTRSCLHTASPTQSKQSPRFITYIREFSRQKSSRSLPVPLVPVSSRCKISRDKGSLVSCRTLRSHTLG